MATMTVQFHKCIQNTQALGEGDEHMFSELYFEIEYKGERHTDLRCDIKQVVGGDFTKDPLEVGPIKGYKGPINYMLFRDAAETYFRSLIGPDGTILNIQGGGLIMERNTFFRDMQFEFEVDERP